MAADACFGGQPNVGMFAVADGHGPNGRRVSQLLAAELASALSSEIKPGLGMELVLKRAYLKLNVQLLRSQVGRCDDRTTAPHESTPLVNAPPATTCAARRLIVRSQARRA